ncbi:peptidoglycan DD-metalloendopeptidase family protein [Pontibacter silvestris]|uniref:Peptidoglycan DD-metalloendopeptidase family protein n=1 Tax=Pontibacter silvestris TaxID=2305183 RepID=A0ABW4X0A5_9BACT|nr:M23 family metallopeptidase [Pontibacter silvestris]MCC9135267.1 peptidoglycan DD-metalloendopeptidase family protein [Pontibacter silvestris]
MSRIKTPLFFVLFLLFALVSSSSSFAQSKGKVKDFFKVKSPKIDYVRPDTTILIKYEEFPDDDSEANKSIYFNPKKELSIVSEDTTELDLGEQHIVEMSEEVLVDSTWIKIAGYYAIWDTHSINPYRIDGRQLKDTVDVVLYDPKLNRDYKMPLVKTPITSHFGGRWGKWHFGTDIDLETGDSVRAAFDGVVRINKWDGGGFGNYIVVRHYNGLETVYGHMSKAIAQPGQFVKAGELIGLGGSTGRSTGSHLHYEVRYQGNPIDPENMYDFPDYLLKGQSFQITSALFNYYNSAGKGSPSSGRRVAYHTIRSGDTLSGIAKKYGVSVSQITKLNGISTRTTLRLGRKLRIR